MIVQNINEDHLAEYMADLLVSMFNGSDNVLVAEAVLMEVSSIDKTDDDDVKLIKPIAKFIVAIGEKLPSVVWKNMANLKVLFDSKSYTIRCAMIQLVGFLITYSATAKDIPETSSSKGLYDILIERFRDKKSFVRVKVLQVLSNLAQ